MYISLEYDALFFSKIIVPAIIASKIITGKPGSNLEAPENFFHNDFFFFHLFLFFIISMNVFIGFCSFSQEPSALGVQRIACLCSF